MKTAEEIDEYINQNGIIGSHIEMDKFLQWYDSKDPEYIDIPEGIRFVTANSRNNLLGLVFNEGKQILAFYDKEKIFQVFSYAYNINTNCVEVPCKLVECKYEDLVAGDIFIYCSKEKDIQNRKEDLAVYTLFLGNDNCVYVGDDENIINFNFSGNDCSHFYKVVKK